jgi:uncharacterized protein YndB with AHSA1/START domain
MQGRASITTTRNPPGAQDVVRDALGRVDVRGLDGAPYVDGAALRPHDDGSLTTTAGGDDGSPLSLETRVNVAAGDDGTRVTVTSSVPDTPDAAATLADIDEAWRTALDELTGDPDATVARTIRASIEVGAQADEVWELWTRAEHVARWWGPEAFRVDVESMDARPGGAWRFTMTGPDGRVYDNEVAYIALDRPRRIVFAHGSDGAPDRFVSIATLEPTGDRTTVTLESRFPSPEDKQRAAEKFGAVEGLRQTLGNLERYLEDVGRPVVIKMRHDAI